MTARAQLQWAYELAFHPARLNAAWNSWEQGNLADAESLNETVSWALMLHQRLPEAPAVSGRALRRLAVYQANSRLYRLPTMLRRFQAKLGIQTTIPEEVPSWVVRDIGLPPLGKTTDRKFGSSDLKLPTAD